MKPLYIPILLIFLALRTSDLIANEQKPMSDSLLAAQMLAKAQKAGRSNSDSMIAYAQMAKEYAAKAEALNLKGEAIILEGIGWYFKGLHDSALSLYLRASTLYQELKNPGGEARALNEIGVLYRKQGALDKSEKVLKKAIALASSAEDLEALGSAYNNLSELYTMKGAYDSSLILIRKSNKIKIKNQDENGLSYNYNSMGVNFAEMGFLDSALFYMQKVLNIRKKHTDLHGLAIAYANMGEVEMYAKQFKKASLYIDSALNVTKEIGYPDLRKHLYLLLSNIHEEIGQYDSALIYFKKYHFLNDSIFNTIRSKQLLELQTKYETAEKDRKIARQELAVKRRNIWLGLTGGGVLFLLIGWISFVVYNRKKAEFIRKESSLREELARQEMLNRIKNERLRISRDLHDNIGAELTLITSALDSKAYSTENEREKEWLSEVSNYSRQAMTDLRETIWAFKSDAMPVNELLSKVREFASKINQVSGIEIKIENQLEREIELTPGQSINLYRISQEALQNALKYSGGKEIRYIIREKGGYMILEISDDGVGFDPKTVKKGYGLAHICERMEDLGGTCKIQSQPGKGTSIIARLPLSNNTI